MNCKTPLRLYDEIEPTLEEAASFIDPESYACPKCRSETDSLYPDEIRSETRAFYRIGQRLRLCPGCKTCRYEPTVKMWKLSRDALWMSGRLGVRDIRHICDGSGVLPAKGKVRR
jgi:hypothetical protein